MTNEEAVAKLTTIVKCLRRLPDSLDEKRTALPLAEELLKEATPPPEFKKRGDAVEGSAVKLGEAAVTAAIERKVERLADDLEDIDSKEVE